MAWANDNKTFFYVTKDKLDRPYKVSSEPHEVCNSSLIRPSIDELALDGSHSIFYPV